MMNLKKLAKDCPTVAKRLKAWWSKQGEPTTYDSIANRLEFADGKKKGLSYGIDMTQFLGTLGVVVHIGGIMKANTRPLELLPNRYTYTIACHQKGRLLVVGKALDNVSLTSLAQARDLAFTAGWQVAEEHLKGVDFATRLALTQKPINKIITTL